MVRNLVVESQPAESPIGQVQFDLFTQFALGTNAIAVRNDEHTEHKLRVDRRTTDVAVVGLKLLAYTGKHARDGRVERRRRWRAGLRSSRLKR